MSKAKPVAGRAGDAIADHRFHVLRELCGERASERLEPFEGSEMDGQLFAAEAGRRNVGDASGKDGIEIYALDVRRGEQDRKVIERGDTTHLVGKVDRRPKIAACAEQDRVQTAAGKHRGRAEEHPSELQSLMRIQYTIFCLHKK